MASANRGVLGGLASDEAVDDESLEDTEPADIVRWGVRLRAAGRFFSSLKAISTTYVCICFSLL